jgi:serine/threonine protein kinase
MVTEDPTDKSLLPSDEADSGVSRPPSPRKSERPSMRPGGPSSLVGRTISGRYRIEKAVGEGGMGIVYAAEHLHIRKRVAVKILHPEMSRMPEVVARFEREAMAAAHIDHPNVAAATDFGKLDDGSFFLVLEYVEGRSLRELILEGRLPLVRALRIMEQIAGALGRAGAMGIVHRDLKPENVMLVQRDGTPDFVKVLDFGIAKVPVEGLSAAEVTRGPTQQLLTQLGMIYGTPEYMAPEQALGQVVDVRADLYALGVITYEMLTGVRPFHHESKVTLLGMHVTAPVPAMATTEPDAGVPKEIEAIVLRLLAKDPSSRFADARELVEATDRAVLELVTLGRLDPSALDRAPGSSLRGQVRERGSLISAAMLGAAENARSASTWTAAKVPAALAELRKKLVAKVQRRPWAIGGAGLGGILFLLFFAKALGGGKAPSTRTGTDPEIARPVPEMGADVDVQARSVKDDPIVLAERMLAQGDTASLSSAIAMLASLEHADPGRADVHRDLERAYSNMHDTKNMLKQTERWIAADPSAATDLRLSEDLRTALLGKEDVDTAFALLEGPMGPAGVDVLYDVAFMGKPQSATMRARRTLQSQQTRSHASAAALVALDLQRASRCEEKRALLLRAKEVGDARSSAILSGFTSTTGCGFLRDRDCWPCLHRDGLLQAAIGAITTRGSVSP